MLVRSCLDRRRWEERAACWPALHPRQVRGARCVLSAPSTATSWCDTRAGRAPRHSVALASFVCRQPCCRPVAVLVRLSFERRCENGARRELAHNTTTPSSRCTAFAPRPFDRFSFARYAIGTRATGYEHATNVFRFLRRRPVVVLVQTSLGWRHGEERARAGPHHNNSKSALRGACPAGGRSILHRAKFAWAARHGVRTRWKKNLERRASDLSLC